MLHHWCSSNFFPLFFKTINKWIWIFWAFRYLYWPDRLLWSQERCSSQQESTMRHRYQGSVVLVFTRRLLKGHWTAFYFMYQSLVYKMKFRLSSQKWRKLLSDPELLRHFSNSATFTDSHVNYMDLKITEQINMFYFHGVWDWQNNFKAEHTGRTREISLSHNVFKDLRE